MTATLSPLKILLLSDGRPGHYTLAEGIIAALARLRPVSTTWVEVRRPAWMPARVLSNAVNTGLPPDRLLKAVYGLDPVNIPDADLIVSAGGNTLAASIALAKLQSIPNVFYGSLRRYRAEDFALVLTSYAAQVAAPHPVMMLKPNKTDPDAIANDPREHIGLIIGGDGGTVRFGEADWTALLSAVDSYHQTAGRRWIISNSPRTAGSISDRIAARAAEPNGPIARFIDVRTAGPGSLGPLFEDSGTILCTADSSSMLSECVWLRRPVIAVSPESWSLPANEAAYRAWLNENGWAAHLPIAELTPKRLTETFAALSPMRENPQMQLASLLQERLPELFSLQA